MITIRFYLTIPIVGFSLFFVALSIIKGHETFAIMNFHEEEKVHIYLAGDSTVSTYKKTLAPRMGWGQVLDEMFNERVMIHNEAVSKRSSKSFYNEGRLTKIVNHLQQGDYLFIQFGHNDEKVNDPSRYTEPFTTYKKYLKKYILAARSKGAFPVLITPVERRKFSPDGHIVHTHGDYPKAMKQLAEEENVPVIDLTSKSNQLFSKLGANKTKELFLWLPPNKNPHFPEGKKDNTHFQERGAYIVASLVIDGIKELNLPIKEHIVNQDK
ncbi:rhamnogalacturonan acetylesterase [Metabacillus litoralis]|uniref:rhamnogalacturonan acetylesterase n=1 Tax=Metabacillus litoralis TaxID=152268 RepID=UPI00214B4549|nr:rhamnogalacturonan acetylesterase [Metabacillus litoralis]